MLRRLIMALLLLLAVLIPANGKEKSPPTITYDIVATRVEGQRYTLSFYYKGEKMSFGMLADDFSRTIEDESGSIFQGIWKRSTSSKEIIPRLIHTSRLFLHEDGCFELVEIESRLASEGEELRDPQYTDSKLQEKTGTWQELGKLRGRLTVKR